MKKRVLFFINGLYGGGAEKVLQTLLHHIDHNKFDITLYGLRKEQLSTDYPANITYRHIFAGGETNANLIKNLLIKIINKFILIVYHHFSPRLFYRLFVRGEYDTEVAFIEGYATRILSGSTNRKSRKLAWVHIDLHENHWTDLAYHNHQEEETAYHKFDRILCVSETVKAQLARLYPSITSSLEVCYNPVDEKRIRSLAEAPLSNEHFLRAGTTLVSIGRLVPQKGYDRLVRIAKELRDEGYDFAINILGEGSDRNMLESFIRDNNLQNHVRLLGFESNPYPYLKSADVFVCSSRSEGYSTAITEALILGKAIVTTEVSGAREQLGDNRLGIMTSNDEQSLLHGIKMMLSNDNTCLYSKIAEAHGVNMSISESISHIENML